MRNQENDVTKVKEFVKESLLPYKAIAKKSKITERVFYNWISGNRFLSNVQLQRVYEFIEDYSKRNFDD